ncbi:AEC family transporter [Flaviflexus huanghaiensis]|uniref:AEC family transporter n=1 Tax=Flaviflexus huanghaiensis TaxID=1111473 RepID=UPI0015FB02C5
MDVVTVSAPFFALILIGYLATRLGLLPMVALPGLNTYVLYFALTAMLFQLGSQTPIAEVLNPWVMATWLSAALFCLALGIGPAVTRGVPWRDAAFGGLTVASPNMGFMGIPLLLALLGADSLGPLMPVMIIDILIVQSLVIALAQRGNVGGSPWAKVTKTARQVLANPLVWAIIAGAAWGASGWSLTSPIAETLALLADSATPVALFTIGGVLAREQTTAKGASSRRMKIQIGWLTFLKLLALPAVVWLIGQAVSRVVPFEELAALVLIAALPTAANTSILAERFGGDNVVVASVILTTTAGGFVTFNVIAALVVGIG